MIETIVVCAFIGGGLAGVSVAVSRTVQRKWVLAQMEDVRIERMGDRFEEYGRCRECGRFNHVEWCPRRPLDHDHHE